MKYRVPNIGCLAYVGLVMTARGGRPYPASLGATGEEAATAPPGDELNLARSSSLPGRSPSRASRKNGPWLVQMGYRRAGFYGYDILENLGAHAEFGVRIVSYPSSSTSRSATKSRSALPAAWCSMRSRITGT